MGEYIITDNANLEDLLSLEVKCLVCGNSVVLQSIYDNPAKICDKCKDAILHIRKHLEIEEE